MSRVTATSKVPLGADSHRRGRGSPAQTAQQAETAQRGENTARAEKSERTDRTDHAERTQRADGRSRRWQAHRTRRRRELSRRARRAVHHRGPDLSMDEFAGAMGTSKSIVYRYFTDKAGLQAAVTELVLEEMAEAFEAAAQSGTEPRTRLRDMVATYVTMLDSSPDVYRFITRSDGGTDLSEFLSAISTYVQRPLADALEATGGDPRLAVTWSAGTVGFVRGIGDSWLAADAEERTDPQTMTDLITHWLWAGAAAGTAPWHDER